MTQKLSHFNEGGKAHMVDVSHKAETARVATASGSIQMNEAAYRAVKSGTAKKGDVLGIARVAGIMATKRTAELVPLCHPLFCEKVEIHFSLHDESRRVEVHCTVKTSGKTGVEMEALCGVQVALLTVYDMCKAVDKGMVMGDICLLEKRGGKSGDYNRNENVCL